MTTNTIMTMMITIGMNAKKRYSHHDDEDHESSDSFNHDEPKSGPLCDIINGGNGADVLVNNNAGMSLFGRLGSFFRFPFFH